MACLPENILTQCICLQRRPRWR